MLYSVFFGCCLNTFPKIKISKGTGLLFFKTTFLRFLFLIIKEFGNRFF